MNYEILYDPRRYLGYQVIEVDSYSGKSVYTIHSAHETEEIAKLVKEALEARKARDNDH